MAQGTVYSVNAVGYVNLEVAPGFQMIANPLNAADNSVGALLPNVENGTTLYKFDPATGYSINSFIFGAWGDPTQELVPGEGAFIQNPSANPQTLTFVGEVPQGNLTQQVPAGFSIQAGQVPQEGGIESVHEFPAEQGDTVYVFDPAVQNYVIYSYIFGSWQPEEPVLEVGQSVFVDKASDSTWARTFSVNE